MADFEVSISEIDLRTLFFILSVIAISGCSGMNSSRWAMDDQDYAEKYSKSYSSNDGEKAARMIKQASDARFVKDMTGFYGGLGILGAEVGVATFPASFSEVRAGARLNGVTYHFPSGDQTFNIGGLDLAARFHTPTRLAPFVGAGTLIGGGDGRANSDSIDNDGDGQIDEFDEEESKFDISFYPEVGAHFWLNSRSRISLLGQYHFTPMPDNKDYAYAGLQLLLLDGLHGLFHGAD